MKRALIAIASVDVLVPAAWVVEANAQQMAPISARPCCPARQPISPSLSPTRP
jgi:hypothetical protein